MDAKQLLKQHGFRATSHRCEVLNYFIKSNQALTHAQLEQKIKSKIDRVSLYRMLHCFYENNFLAKIIDSNNNTSYIFNQQIENTDKATYPLFKCKTCHTVIQLPQLPENYLKSLQSKNIDKLQILAEGTCENCIKKK